MERELVFGSRSFKAPDGRVVKKSSIAQLARLSCPTEILEGEGRGAPAEYSVKSTLPIAPVGSVKKCQESVHQLSWDPGEERRGSVTQSVAKRS